MKKIGLLFGLALLALAPIAVHAQTTAATETMVFDSSDNYLGACSYTTTATWTQTGEIAVSKFQLWYNWQSGETELPVTVTKDGAAFDSFTATRSSCDPYQTSWCNADYAVNKTFPAGSYTATVANAHVCLKPGGTGVVRLYSLAAATNTNAADTTNANLLVAAPDANTNTATNRAAVNSSTNTAVDVTTTASDDTGSSNTLVYVLIGIIIILVIVIIVMVMKCAGKKSQLK